MSEKKQRHAKRRPGQTAGASVQAQRDEASGGAAPAKEEKAAANARPEQHTESARLRDTLRRSDDALNAVATEVRGRSQQGRLQDADKDGIAIHGGVDAEVGVARDDEGRRGTGRCGYVAERRRRVLRGSRGVCDASGDGALDPEVLWQCQVRQIRNVEVDQ